MFSVHALTPSRVGAAHQTGSVRSLPVGILELHALTPPFSLMTSTLDEAFMIKIVKGQFG